MNFFHSWRWGRDDEIICWEFLAVSSFYGYSTFILYNTVHESPIINFSPTLLHLLLQKEAQRLTSFCKFMLLQPILYVHQSIKPMILINVPKEEQKTYLISFTPNNSSDSKFEYFPNFITHYILLYPSMGSHRIPLNRIRAHSRILQWNSLRHFVYFFHH